MTTHIVAFGNEKGGAGKTSVTLGVASMLAKRAKSVLLIDLDPQRTLTQAFDLDQDRLRRNIFDVLAQDAGETPDPGLAEHAIVATGWELIDLVPGSRQLANIAAGRVKSPSSSLANALNGDFLDDYDYVLIDMPPQVGRISEIALEAADLAYGVTQAIGGDVQGLNDFTQTLSDLGWVIDGVIVSNFDKRRGEQAFNFDELRKAYGEKVLEPIPARAAIYDMAAYNMPLTALGSNGGRALQEAFRKVVVSIEQKAASEDAHKE